MILCRLQQVTSDNEHEGLLIEGAEVMRGGQGDDFPLLDVILEGNCPVVQSGEVCDDTMVRCKCQGSRLAMVGSNSVFSRLRGSKPIR